MTNERRGIPARIIVWSVIAIWATTTLSAIARTLHLLALISLSFVIAVALVASRWGLRDSSRPKNHEEER
jgi:hypothetical protein